MFARSTTIQAQASTIDAGIAHVRDEVMPTIQGIEGCIGLSMLVDRQSGRCIATSAWQSEEAMRASQEQVRPIRDRAVEVFAGGPQCGRSLSRTVTTGRVRAHVCGPWGCRWSRFQVERAIDVFKMASRPRSRLEGFCRASMLIDRASGRTVPSVTYDSLEAMEPEQSAGRGGQSGGHSGSTRRVLDVCEFDFAIAHLHVPEMA